MKKVGNFRDIDGNEYYSETVNFYIDNNNKDILNTFIRFAVISFGEDIEMGNITIPLYSKGLLIASNSNDASLIAVDYNGNLYVTFRNGRTWGNGRKL